jgi:hypothetical protein
MLHAHRQCHQPPFEDRPRHHRTDFQITLRYGTAPVSKPASNETTGRTKHGARSRTLEWTDIRRIERTWKRRYGANLSTMTAYQRGCLREFARAERILERLDSVIQSNGVLGQDGGPSGFMSTYLAALNSAGRHLERLEASMGHKVKERDKHALLDELAKYRGSAS